MRAALALLGLVRVAAADPAPAPAPAQPAPDPIATSAAEEANLESIAPRSGFTAAAAFGGSLMVGGDGGVGRGGALSMRIGQVATPNTIITFELVGGSALHGMNLLNNDVNGLVGAQYYVAPVVWLRGGGGFGVYTRDDGPMTQTTPGGKHTYMGPAGAAGVGVDIFQRHYFRIDLEMFSIAKIARDGVHTTSAFCLGFAYY